MKKILFHTFALAVLIMLLATAGGVVDNFLEGDSKYTITSVLSTIGAFIAAYYGLGSALSEIYKRYHYGITHDFLHFLLNKYFILNSPLAEIKTPDFERKMASLRKSCRVYIDLKLNEDRILPIKKISDIPFTCYDYTGRIFETKDPLPQTVCNFHTDHFDGATTSFVIGEAGTGKSFTLRQIALSLLDKKHSKTIVPVFIPISSWQKDIDIYSWIVNMTSAMYMNGKDQGYLHELICNTPENFEIIYLFDGLDEIGNEMIDKFFHEITRVIGEKHVIIGTRKEVFSLFKEKGMLFHFQHYEMNVLSREKIEETIHENIISAKANAILSIPEIYKEFNTPLLIGLLVKVANGKESLEGFLKAKSIQEYVWDEFPHIVYSEKTKNGTSFSYSLSTLRNYAGWMAKRESQFFSLDDLQPSTLGETGTRWAYAIISRLLIGLVISIGIGFTMSGPLDFIPAGLLGGLISTIAFLLPIKHWFNSDLSQKKSIILAHVKIFGVSIIFSFLSLLIFGVYFSLSGQRRDMIQIIAPADWIIGILFAIMFTILGALRDFRYSFSNDIQLIQKRNIFRFDALDFPMAMIVALVLGLIVSFICAILSVLFTKAFPDNIFTGWMRDTSYNWKMSVFAMIYWMVFPVAASIGLLVGMNNPKYYKFDEISSDEEKKRLLPYYSVSRTIYSSLALSFIVMIMFAFLWGWVNMHTFGTGWEAGNKGIENGLAAGVFIGLWWGWKDILKVWTLRLLLFLRREAPFSFTTMLKDLEKLGIVIRNGARYNFLDPTLHRYLCSDQYKHIKPANSVNWICSSLIIFVITIICMRIYWKDKYYWQSPNEGLNITTQSKLLMPIINHRVLALENGAIIVETKGVIQAGRILGNITPLGTQTGFFGMPLNSSFNTVPNYKHGALIYRRNSQSPWKPVHSNNQLQFLDTYPPLKTYRDTIAVSKNDTLEFTINDIEWQNDSKDFWITVRHIQSDTNSTQR